MDFATIRRILHRAARGRAKGSRHLYDTSDIAQESLVQILEKNPQPADVPAGYLHSVAAGHAVSLRRFHTAKKRQPDATFADSAATKFAAQGAKTPEEIAVAREQARHVLKAVGKLEPTDRLVILLRLVDGESLRSTAKQVGETIDVVRGRIKRATLQLRRHINASGDQNDH